MAGEVHPIFLLNNERTLFAFAEISKMSDLNCSIWILTLVNNS